MYKYLLILTAILVMGACNSGVTSGGITGTYINHSADENGQLWDTLEISTLNPRKNLYAVVKKSGIQHIRDGKDTLPIENNSVNYTATYNGSTHNFYIKELGADFMLDPTDQIISNSQVKYIKAK